MTHEAIPVAGKEPDYAAVKADLLNMARLLNVKPFDVPQRVDALQTEVQQLREQIKQLEASGAVSAEALLKQAEEIGGVKVIVAETPAANPNMMRGWIDQLRKSASPIAVLLASVTGDKVLFVAGASHELVDRGVNAGGWVKAAAQATGGGGGGKPDMAQAGGKDPAKLPDAIAAAKKTIADMLS
jgi:alanyl-tRNA synthetase